MGSIWCVNKSYFANVEPDRWFSKLIDWKQYIIAVTTGARVGVHTTRSMFQLLWRLWRGICGIVV